jgi:two-component system LytT family response regulator
MGEPARIRTLVVDDEPLAREGLRMLLAQDPDVELIGECADGRAATAAVRRLRPDLLFLDVQMPEMSGFDVLAELAAPDDAELPAVIFVTAYDRYALRAFEVHALDYLLKPFDDERFGRALERGKAYVRSSRAAALTRHFAALFDNHVAPAPRSPDRIAVKDRGRLVFVPVDAIDWIGAEDYYAELHVGGSTHLLREPLCELEVRLDPNRFVRVHRSAIVNVTRVREVESSTRGDAALVLEDGTRLRLSRGRRAAILARLGVAAH